MTADERIAAESRIAEIAVELKRLSEERVELRRQLVHSTAEWLDMRARLDAKLAIEEREEAARVARVKNRDPNPVPFNERHEDRRDDGSAA